MYRQIFLDSFKLTSQIGHALPTPVFQWNIQKEMVEHMEEYDVSDYLILLNYLRNDLQFKADFRVKAGDDLVSRSKTNF